MYVRKVQTVNEFIQVFYIPILKYKFEDLFSFHYYLNTSRCWFNNIDNILSVLKVDEGASSVDWSKYFISMNTSLPTLWVWVWTSLVASCAHLRLGDFPIDGR